MAILVTGGAGYIGSHMVLAAIERGEEVVVVDNLSTGVRGHVATDAHFVEGGAGDRALIGKIIAEHKIDAIVHFAGSIVVPESVADPLSYYENNTVVARNLIEAAVEGGVRHFIFSSTAAVYGENLDGPVVESSAANPINPYGRSKLMTEWMLEDCARAYDFRYVALRYFNVAGADPKAARGNRRPTPRISSSGPARPHSAAFRISTFLEPTIRRRTGRACATTFMSAISRKRMRRRSIICGMKIPPA
jgi:UDP-glucose 4-epimerase